MAIKPEMRENPDRAIHITGPIDQGLVYRLIPDIMRLRGDCSQHITVYIDSPGGNIRFADQILSMLRSRNQDGKRCRIVTVAVNSAHSAAAGLLAQGDYAIAYPHAVIHCHGTRTSRDEITSDEANSLAARLRELDNDYAIRLAMKSVERMLFRYGIRQGDLHKAQEEFKKENNGKEADDLGLFATDIGSLLSSELRHLPNQAYKRYRRVLEMKNKIFEKPMPDELQDQPIAKFEAVILSRILDYELDNQDLKLWNLSSGGLEEMVLHFYDFKDYLIGSHTKKLIGKVKHFASMFLSQELREEYAKLLESDKNAAKVWMEQRVRPLLEPMCYYVACVCRILYSDEHPLGAEDAYWLGLIDEVIGNPDLISLREISEDSPDVKSDQQATP